MLRIATLGLLIAAAPVAGDPWDALERFDHPPLVSGSYKGETLEKVLADLGRQAGCPVPGVPRGGAPVTLEVKDLPYWAALDQAAAAAGCVVTGSAFEDPKAKDRGFGDGDPLRLRAAEKDLLPSVPCIGGPARVSLVAVVSERSGKAVSRFSPEAEPGEAGKTTLRVLLKAALLDGFERVEFLRLRVDTAVDEKGRALKVVEGDGKDFDFGRNKGAAGARTIHFDAAGERGERIAELKGALEVVVPHGEEAADIDLATLPATAKIGGASITVKAVTDRSVTVEVKGEALPGLKELRRGFAGLRSVGEGGDEGGGFPRGMREIAFTARDGAGKVLKSTGSNGSGFGSTMTYEVDLDGRAAKFSVRACTKAEKREIPFRFTDIPLPR